MKKYIEQIEAPSWLINQKVEEVYEENHFMIHGDLDKVLEKETEKAYLIGFVTDFGVIGVWFPKSLTNLVFEK